MNGRLKRSSVMQAFQANKPARAAVAAVEFAVVLPLIVMLVLGALEAARAVMVTHALQEASQAACRVYSVGGTAMADVTAIIDDAMAAAGITNFNTTFNPQKKEDVDKTMKEITVTISVAFADVAWLPPNFLAGATLEGRSVLPADLEVSDGGDTDGYVFTNDDYNGDGYVRDN